MAKNELGKDLTKATLFAIGGAFLFWSGIIVVVVVFVSRISTDKS